MIGLRSDDEIDHGRAAGNLVAFRLPNAAACRCRCLAASGSRFLDLFRRQVPE